MTGTLKTAYIQNPAATDRNISIFANNNTTFANNVTIANNATIGGNSSITGTLTVTGNTSVGNLNVTGAIIGTITGTTNLSNISVTSTANLGNLIVTGAAYQGLDSLTDNTTIQIDMSLGNNFNVTLGGARTLGTPTNLNPGQSGVIYVSQDATGSRTLAYSSVWRFPSGTAPTLSTAANTVDAIAYSVRTTSNIMAQLISNIG